MVMNIQKSQFLLIKFQMIIQFIMELENLNVFAETFNYCNFNHYYELIFIMKQYLYLY